MERPAAYNLLPYDTLRDLLEQTAENPFPTIDDRDAWERIARTPQGKIIRDAALADAEEMAAVPNVRTPTLTEFLLWTRTGNRRTWEQVAGEFGKRIDAFTLAACFTGEDRWIDHAADALWAECELTTWTTPAHEGKTVPEPDNPTVDLWSAMRAQEVGEAIQVLRPALDRIDTRIVRHLHREIDRRVFMPFLARSDWWWLWKHDRERLNNWTAVCSGGVLCGALAALNHDRARQARVVQKAAWSLQFFKETFDVHGSLDEGAGYWSYGVSYFAMAAERLAARTNGIMDPLADPIWQDIAAFPLKVRLYGDTFVNFSDCAPEVVPAPGWIYWLGQHTGVSGLQEWAQRLVAERFSGYGLRHRHLPFVLRTLLWLPETSGAATVSESPATSYLPDVEWLIARSDTSDNALILAAKGGHNAENHNHNDVGSFIIHWQQEPFVAELGAPTYDRFFFSGTRYENIAARSLGHSVPLVNGQEQRAGRMYEASEVQREQDGSTETLTMNLAGAYGEEAHLQTLVRRLSLNRGTEPFITVTDEARFTNTGGTFALPIVEMDRELKVVEAGKAEIRSGKGVLEVTWDPAEATCRAEDVPSTDVKFVDSDGRTRIRRLWFDVTVTGNTARLSLTFTPRQ
ncbi:MAG: hypothetical protein OHK0029_33180 [Armatimonadaceae bacterium]